MLDVLIIQDLSKLLRVSPSVLYAWKAAGTLLDPLPLPGRVLRWSRQEVEAWAAAGMPPAREWRKRRQQEACAP